MSFIVVTSERAARDIEEAAVWWARERSVEQAERWYQGILAAIAELPVSHMRFAVAPEQSQFAYEIRELHFGLGSRPTHRVLFTVVKETVVVLTVRHVAQMPIRPEDLP